MHNYGHMFRTISCALGQNINNALSDTGLTFSQGHVMGYLALSQQPPCVKDMEEHLQLTHPTISGLLSRLEKKGFVIQKPDPQDRRRKLVYLTPKGNRCLETISAVIAQGEEQLVQDFSPEERQQFRNYLTRALHNVSPDAIFPKEEFHK